MDLSEVTFPVYNLELISLHTNYVAYPPSASTTLTCLQRNLLSQSRRDVFPWGAGCASLAWDMLFPQIGSLYLRPVIYISDDMVKR